MRSATVPLQIYSMRLCLALIALLVAGQLQGATTIRLLHFSDYHSHALPFYSEGQPDQGGIARAVGFLRRQKERGALVFSGGDMVNKGAPAWSDRFQCAEWLWLNGVVDAMAFGNHDADYGHEAFVRCREAVSYPILSANTHGLQPYTVLLAKGKRIGVFAVAGPDFPALVKAPELRFADPVTAAREIVRQLREVEKVDAVIMIGHQTSEDDHALARSVPGIDLIFGSHSHRRQELMLIPETNTGFISPFQYLTYISQVDLTFSKGKITLAGRLVQMNSRVLPDRITARRVASMDDELRTDPAYRDLFVPFATLSRAMEREELATHAVAVMRAATGAVFAISTSSSFRGALPPGRVDGELLLAALPYDNEIVVAELPAAAVAKLLTLAGSADGSVTAGAAAGETVLVAATDYLAMVAPGYRDVFQGAKVRRTGLRVREEVRKSLAARWPVGTSAP